MTEVSRCLWPRGPSARRSWGWALGLSLVAAVDVAHADSEGLIVETGSPDAFCPDLALTRDAVRRRLGELVVAGSSGWRARYTIGHAPAGNPRDFVRLELFDPDGTRVLERDLPLEGESCSTMAEVIALVLDRHFRTLHVHEREPDTAADAGAASPAPLPEPPLDASAPNSEPPAASPPVQAAASPPVTTTAPVPAPTVAEVATEPEAPVAPMAFLGVVVGADQRPAAVVGVHGNLKLWRDVYVGSALLVPLTSETQQLATGEVSARTYSARLHAGWGPALGRLRAFVGPGLCLMLQHGSGRGLPRESSGYRAAWAAGVNAGVIWPVQAGLLLTLSGALEARIPGLSGRFVIDGVEVLEPRPVGGWLGVGLGYGF